jgi:heme-degrading monooxygenase HmoA
MIANTPTPPYFAVIFTSLRTKEDKDYEKITHRMVELAKKQQGFLGVESAREEIGITVSYWSDLESIKLWKEQWEHKIAQEMGREFFYTTYKTRICIVQKDYIFEKK